MAHVAALGVLLSAAFGGFGSAALPHGCLEGMHLPPYLPALAVADPLRLDFVLMLQLLI